MEVPLSVLVLREVEKVCPIEGVCIRDKNNKATWRLDFKDNATPTEKVAAAIAIANFNNYDTIPPLIAAIDKMINRSTPPVDPDLKAILIEWRKIL